MGDTSGFMESNDQPKEEYTIQIDQRLAGKQFYHPQAFINSQIDLNAVWISLSPHSHEGQKHFNTEILIDSNKVGALG